MGRNLGDGYTSYALIKDAALILTKRLMMYKRLISYGLTKLNAKRRMPMFTFAIKDVYRSEGFATSGD